MGEYTETTKIKWTANIGPCGVEGIFELGELYDNARLANMSEDAIEHAIHSAVFEAASEHVDLGWETK